MGGADVAHEDPQARLACRDDRDQPHHAVGHGRNRAFGCQDRRGVSVSGRLLPQDAQTIQQQMREQAVHIAVVGEHGPLGNVRTGGDGLGGQAFQAMLFGGNFAGSLQNARSGYLGSFLRLSCHGSPSLLRPSLPCLR